MMHTSSPSACTREDEDVLHQYGSSSPSHYVFFALFYFFILFCSCFSFILKFSTTSVVVGKLGLVKPI